jgi:hypothetical protein
VLKLLHLSCNFAGDTFHMPPSVRHFHFSITAQEALFLFTFALRKLGGGDI